MLSHQHRVPVDIGGPATYLSQMCVGTFAGNEPGERTLPLASVRWLEYEYQDIIKNEKKYNEMMESDSIDDSFKNDMSTIRNWYLNKNK